MSIAEDLKQVSSTQQETVPTSWVTLHRELLARVAASHPNPEERLAYELTPEYLDALQLVLDLRRDQMEVPKGENLKVITVRMTETMHEALKNEAHRLHTSMNRLTITKLLMPINPKFVPLDT